MTNENRPVKLGSLTQQAIRGMAENQRMKVNHLTAGDWWTLSLALARKDRKRITAQEFVGIFERVRHIRHS